MSEYFDCTLRAGYYKLFGGPVGEHTFVIGDCNGERYAFPCFGGYALTEGEHGNSGVVFPAELWSPYMIFSTAQGKSLPANLYVALGMAQWNLAPTYEYHLSDWERWWSQLPAELRYLSPSCNAGLTYAVTGVCQQACNRILWATRQDSFTYTPVNWPPSFSASYWVYGYYGKIMENEAIAFANELVRRAKSMALGGASFAIEGGPGAAEKQAEKEMTDAALSQTRKALTAEKSPQVRQEEIKKILEAAPAGKQVATSRQLSGMLTPDQHFQQVKAELDKQLLRGEVSHDEYAKQVNAEFNRMLEEFRNILPAETFKALFREAAEGKQVEIIAREQMPESYAPIQEALRI